MSTWRLRRLIRALLPLLLVLTLLEIVGIALVLAQFEAALFQYPFSSSSR
jgi:cation transporter-like permease